MTCCPTVPPRPEPPAITGPAITGPAITGRPGRDLARVVEIPGGPATTGTDAPFFRDDGEGPARRGTLARFRIDAHAVSNRRFAAFVAATGHVTDAERYGWSYVFQAFADPAQRSGSPEGTPWWFRVDGACWSAPNGPGSAADPDHPATHIAWNDALAFARYAGGRLPSEAEWEQAAKGGDDAARFPWGAEEPDDGNALCNIWQGTFPQRNNLADGYLGTAPVEAYAANGYGLFNASGNVWEWCADAFRLRSLSAQAKGRNRAAAAERERVMKGGSYLCHRSYCYRYRIAARSGRSPDTSAGHLGFRLAY